MIKHRFQLSHLNHSHVANKLILHSKFPVQSHINRLINHQRNHVQTAKDQVSSQINDAVSSTTQLAAVSHKIIKSSTWEDDFWLNNNLVEANVKDTIKLLLETVFIGVRGPVILGQPDTVQRIVERLVTFLDQTAVAHFGAVQALLLAEAGRILDGEESERHAEMVKWNRGCRLFAIQARFSQHISRISTFWSLRILHCPSLRSLHTSSTQIQL